VFCLWLLVKRKVLKILSKAFNAGQRDFGENYIQESIEKISKLKKLDIIWHYIGKIQSNKSKIIAR
jgi:uncharacterized pyridoxal phosphate-containing UPF0001 family protein